MLCRGLNCSPCNVQVPNSACPILSAFSAARASLLPPLPLHCTAYMSAIASAVFCCLYLHFCSSNCFLPRLALLLLRQNLFALSVRYLALYSASCLCPWLPYLANRTHLCCLSFTATWVLCVEAVCPIALFAALQICRALYAAQCCHGLLMCHNCSIASVVAAACSSALCHSLLPLLEQLPARLPVAHRSIMMLPLLCRPCI